MIVIKRNGDKVNFDPNKIVNALKKANSETKGSEKLSDSAIDIILKNIVSKLLKTKEINVELIQDLVINELKNIGYSKLAKEYSDYRKDHEIKRMKNSSFMKNIISKLEATDVKNQNANVDEYSFGGRRGEASSELDKYVALNYTMSKWMKDLHENNEIYIHDLDSYSVGLHNCLTVPMEQLLKYGFKVRQTDIRPANSINTAFQLIAVLFQVQSLQQFGGTSCIIDSLMVPYFRKSFYKHYKEVSDIIPFINGNWINKIKNIDEISIDNPIYKGKTIFNIKKRYIYKKALNMTLKETKQAVEGMYHNLNSLQSRSGNQLPFTSINYGTDTTTEGRYIIKALLDGSIKGIGKFGRTPIFPCGIFQIKKGINLNKGDPNYDLKKLAIKSTIKRLYPNYANLDWSNQQDWVRQDREMKQSIIDNLDKETKRKLIDFIKNNPKIGHKLYLKVENNELIVEKEEQPSEKFSTMGCVDGEEVIRYSLNEIYYTESFKRMWYRIATLTSCKPIQQNKNDSKNLYIETSNINLKIFDTEKNDYIKVKKIIRNTSNRWCKIKIEGGRLLDCTEDHPLPIVNRGRIFAKDVNVDDKIMINNSTIIESSKYRINNDISWLMGMIIGDGCLSNDSICISVDFKSEKDLVSKIKNVCENTLYCECIVKERHRLNKGDYYDIILRSDKNDRFNVFRNELISLFGGIVKNNRKIPNLIFNSDYETRLAFMSGMIDADGYIDNHRKNCRVQIRSVNKELSIQQMYLAQSIGYNAFIYENNYSKNKIGYRVEFTPNNFDLKKYIISKKKLDHFSLNEDVKIERNNIVSIRSVEFYDCEKYSYDVTTESDHFEVSGIYSHNCRTVNGADINYDSEYYLNQINSIISGKMTEMDLDRDMRSKAQKDGRGNICPCTIILPTIAMEVVERFKENTSASTEFLVSEFLKKLDSMIDLAKDGLIERYNHIKKQDPKSACFMWDNVTMAGYKSEIGPESALKHGTLAIGQIGLAETLQILIGTNQLNPKGITLAKQIEKLYSDKCKKFKEEYKLNFGVYYTPAENLCYTSMIKFQKKYGKIPNISDKDFFTNSMHVPVWEKIDPFKKIDCESQLTGYSNAGCITYIEIGDSCIHNEKALEEFIDYAMKKDIPYFAINLPNDTCESCGYQGQILENESCPCCGEKDDISRLRRVTGYITSSYIKAFNKGKIQETQMRYKHTESIDKSILEKLK